MSLTHEQPFGGLPRELRDMIWRELLTVPDVFFRKPANAAATSARKSLVIPKLERPLGTAGQPIHQRLFMTNKQVYAETALIFYSSNHFTADTDDVVTAEQSLARIRPEVRRLRLESRLSLPSIQVHGSGFRNQHLSLVHHKLNVVSINMPVEPPARLPHEAFLASICPTLAVDLVDCLLKGLVKSLRLVYPAIITRTDPEQLFSIKILRKGRRAFRGDEGLGLQCAWYGFHRSAFLTVLNSLHDIPDQKFIARFEHAKHATLTRDKSVIVLSRLEDEPVKRETVDRPRVTIVGPNTHLKRRLPASPRIADPRPAKFLRLQMPSCVAFSDSRTHNMSRRAVHERQTGRTAQLLRLISDKGPILAQIPRQTYHWQHHPNHGL